MPPLLAVVMDPPERLHPEKDTTRVLLEAAQERGWRLCYLPPSGLRLSAEGVVGRGFPLEVRPTASADWYHLGEECGLPLREAAAVLLRSDPPFDLEYLHLTHILEAARRNGTLVVNDPQGVRDHNEKLAILRFPSFIPTTIVSRDLGHLERFLAEEGRVVLKPLDAMGGEGIFVLAQDDPNRRVALETMTRGGKTSVMMQRYLPEIRDGDARVLVIDGHPFEHALVRVPAPGETRGNLARGGRAHVRPLNAAERRVAEAIGPALREAGLLFVGLDLIGGFLTEINVTSPTGARELERATSTPVGARLIEALQQRLEAARGNNTRG
jgi:glutathione synthase